MIEIFLTMIVVQTAIALTSEMTPWWKWLLSYAAIVIPPLIFLHYVSPFFEISVFDDPSQDFIVGALGGTIIGIFVALKIRKTRSKRLKDEIPTGERANTD